MGREVRRVPTDFEWPINKTWDGFLVPDGLLEDPCPDCYTVKYNGSRSYGSGQTAAGKWLDGWLHLLGMMAEDVPDQSRDDGVPITQRITGPGGTERMHPYLQSLHGICIYEHRRPSADIVDLVDGLLGPRPHVGCGYATDVARKVSQVLVSAAGLPEGWGTCPTCEGHGCIERYPGQRTDAEAWEPTPPPTGEGWQLWETVSEGSPISPVFDSPEGLAGWMSSPAYHWGVSRPMRYPDALAFVTGDGWAPSMVVGPSGLVAGEQWVADRARAHTDEQEGGE